MKTRCLNKEYKSSPKINTVYFKIFRDEVSCQVLVKCSVSCTQSELANSKKVHWSNQMSKKEFQRIHTWVFKSMKCTSTAKVMSNDLPALQTISESAQQRGDQISKTSCRHRMWSEATKCSSERIKKVRDVKKHWVKMLHLSGFFL